MKKNSKKNSKKNLTKNSLDKKIDNKKMCDNKKWCLSDFGSVEVAMSPGNGEVVVNLEKRPFARETVAVTRLDASEWSELAGQMEEIKNTAQDMFGV